jgi:hypothetical protein
VERAGAYRTTSLHRQHHQHKTMSPGRPARALVLAVLLAAGCLRQTSLGTLGCRMASDCAPPQSVCGPDARCVAGCGVDESSCAAGSVCDPSTGDCSGGIIGMSCADDRGCDPPDIVCRPSTGTCVAGCTLAADCDAEQRCDALTGRCCNPSSPSCVAVSPPTAGCASDAACADPARVCVNGACIASCNAGGSCTTPLECDPHSGHCVVPSCTLDIDCDATSACSAGGSCYVLAHAAPGPCSGGGPVAPYRCATEENAAEFAQCAGAPGPAGCPYCLDGSCFEAGLCTSAADCRDGATCTQGLCLGTANACANPVSISDVIGGHYGAGKLVCVRGKVISVRSGYDGMIELKLGDAPYLYVDVAPMYRSAGVTLPNVGATVRAHGAARWDAGHDDWELSPVDWIGP